ncbi:sigma-54-dependent transcriptional regulator [Thalassorhabdomicrobium marinisediminis]|uniref:response regulator n=1 Tax=Thalassorhabdomicrobium marinisediminis TaxID=2170577 RepID=UPI00249330FB|nr:sigma-54 dependent transcriptional regulator [Thalassorhabdomicrobium marinisediminis]
MDGTILVADDDRTIRTVLTQALTRAGCKVHATSSLVTLMRWVTEGMGDLVISDVVMPDGNGLTQVPQIAQLRPDLPVIVISAQNTIMTTIQATEAEAFDYLPKPFDLPDLMQRVARGLNRKSPKPEPRDDRATADLPLVGRSAPMQALYRLLARVMNTPLPVLVTGESGSGKSLVARAIHDLSDRQGRPFLVATAATFDGPPDAGAGLLAQVGAGTLVLEEVADLTDTTQAQIVALLDHVATLTDDTAPRVIATSRGDLEGALSGGRLRSDLFYRLAGVTLPVPALRDRVEDIVLLAAHFLARAAQDGGPDRGIERAAGELLRSYPWPGNVRQLENIMRRLAVTAAQPEITRAEVEQALAAQPAAGPLQPPPTERLADAVAQHLGRYFDLHGDSLPPAGLYQRILREIETPLLEIALEATAGNQAKCAELLGINRNTLRKKLTDLDIRVTRGRKLM